MERRPWLKAADLRDFRFYHRLMKESLESIDRKRIRGELRPLNLVGFPQVVSFPRYRVRAGLFIGSFDPFQMTHLTMALQFLASPQSRADVVFVVPEGAANARKPHRSEYSFLFEVLRAQIAKIFHPLIVPLDIGAQADTIEIVRRFIGLFPGSTMELTHLMGTDSLPFVVRYGKQDREVWDLQAARDNVKLDYRIHAIPRDHTVEAEAQAMALGAQGVNLTIDALPVRAPSSTDLRQRAVFTILFPAASVLRRIEILFRYSMNASWTSAP